MRQSFESTLCYSSYIFTFQVTDDVLVLVPTTRGCLRSLALAVASSCPVLLEGPVGSGKTALVEQLARLMGRGRPPELMKIQLGDQTDSKVTPHTVQPDRPHTNI